MPKSQVSPTLPIEFSEVCEVVYQDLLGTNGRSLAGCFAVANASGKTYDANYVGIKDRLSNFRGFPVIVPGDSVYFDADYAIIEFKFLTGQDLDIRAQVTTPTVSDYIGWARLGVFPASNSWLFWGGDNRGTGVESIFIDISYYKTFYPTQKLSIDMRAFWYAIPTIDPVSFKITLYKGGTKWPAAVNYGFGVDNPTASLVLGTELKEIKLNTNVAANAGQSIGVWEYNPSTFLSKVTIVTDNTAPTAPTLSVVSVTGTTVTLSWAGSTDANSPIKYALHSPTLSAEDRDNSANAWWDITSPFTVTGLIAGTPVSYYIKAYDPTGNYSGASNTVNTTPVEADTTPPSNVGVGNTSNYTTTSIQLNWEHATDASGISGYNIYNEAYALWFSVGNVNTYTKTGLSPGTLYTFHIKAIDASVNNNISTGFYTLGSVWTLCVAPTLTYVSETSTSITLSRNSVTGADTYSLYWKINGGTYALATSAMGTSYTKTGLTDGNTYLFYVVANNPAGYPSASSNIITRTISTVDTTPPSKVAGLFIDGDFGDHVTLNWSAATDNVGVHQYEYNKSLNGSSWDLGVQVLHPTTSAFVATSPETLYYFRVRAYDAAGNAGEWSNTLQYTTGSIA